MLRAQMEQQEQHMADRRESRYVDLSSLIVQYSQHPSKVRFEWPWTSAAETCRPVKKKTALSFFFSPLWLLHSETFDYAGQFVRKVFIWQESEIIDERSESKERGCVPGVAHWMFRSDYLCRLRVWCFAPHQYVQCWSFMCTYKYINICIAHMY